MEKKREKFTVKNVIAEGDFVAAHGDLTMVDQLVADEVEKLVDRIRAEQGRLDVLVNDIWGGEYLKEWNKPVWEHDLQSG